jgi:D-tagatose-bisphosphate aldolase class II non-catalytic subunit
VSEMLRDIIRRNRAGELVAIPSVCSAHPDVLTASLLLARDKSVPLVIEATSNQVNQEGGYTGMKPANFISFVSELSKTAGCESVSLAFGGDHLGPQVWRKSDAETAMAKARVMVADYVRAGFTKIHLDCSEGCAGEPPQLPDEITAARAADLAKVALQAATDASALMFVIGTEVPPPGGARADESGDIAATKPEAAIATLRAHERAFAATGIPQAMAQVGGLVVQPGVEFSPMHVHDLPQSRDPGLKAALADWPQICLEAHSTDYQKPEVYPRLAELGFAFQKVGPALTFAWREAVYTLDTLARQAGWLSGESLPEVMERLMLADPGFWQGHYRGDSGDLRVERHFGLADRIRYYWPRPEAQAALHRLFAAFEGRALPDPLLHQGFDDDVIALAHRIGGAPARALTLASVQRTLMPYLLGGAR